MSGGRREGGGGEGVVSIGHGGPPRPPHVDLAWERGTSMTAAVVLSL